MARYSILGRYRAEEIGPLIMEPRRLPETARKAGEAVRVFHAPSAHRLS